MPGFSCTTPLSCFQAAAESRGLRQTLPLHTSSPGILLPPCASTRAQSPFDLVTLQKTTHLWLCVPQEYSASRNQTASLTRPALWEGCLFRNMQKLSFWVGGEKKRKKEKKAFLCLDNCFLTFILVILTTPLLFEQNSFESWEAYVLWVSVYFGRCPTPWMTWSLDLLLSGKVGWPGVPLLPYWTFGK